MRLPLLPIVHMTTVLVLILIIVGHGAAQLVRRLLVLVSLIYSLCAELLCQARRGLLLLLLLLFLREVRELGARLERACLI